MQKNNLVDNYFISCHISKDFCIETLFYNEKERFYIVSVDKYGKNTVSIPDYDVLKKMIKLKYKKLGVTSEEICLTVTNSRTQFWQLLKSFYHYNDKKLSEEQLNKLIDFKMFEKV